MNPDTAVALLQAAEVLAKEARLPKNRDYQHAYLLAAAHYRKEATEALRQANDTETA